MRTFRSEGRHLGAQAAHHCAVKQLRLLKKDEMPAIEHRQPRTWNGAGKLAREVRRRAEIAAADDDVRRAGDAR